MSKPDSLIEPLTKRELEILSLLVANRTNNEIAASLSLSLNSVKWYARQIYGKLGVENRRQAAAKAEESGLLVTASTADREDKTLPLPSGTVTFLFTDIENSTQLWERQPTQMQAAFARQEAIFRQVVSAQDGYAYKMIGDAFQVAFKTASAAVRAALEAQRQLQAEPWGQTPIRMRMALHTGVTEERGDDYVGPALNRVARLLNAGYGGQVLLTQATCELVRDDLPPGASLLDLGEYRLKDLVRPEHIYQLLINDLQSEFPPLKSLDAFPNNLPIQLTSFIGRKTEMVNIKLLLVVDHASLVTLTGSGGTGKTRLALQVAADLLDKYLDGVWLVELAQLADPALIPQTVATALGVREVPGKSITTVLTEHLRSRQLLLVLDNCEHVIEACARLVSMLLRVCPRLQILATSREILGATGEVPFRVPSLSIPELRHLPAYEKLPQYEAVNLFLERASQAMPGFILTADNAPAIARICHRLDGIPLAIELAAARVRLLSVEQLASRLDDSFRLLTGGSRTVLPRHQTLKALIDWSYNLLSAPERTLLLRLSVFAGGWTLEAAEEIVMDEDGLLEDDGDTAPSSSLPKSEVLGYLGQLVDKSLVMEFKEQGGPGTSRERRYRLLETIRQYARDKLLEVGGGEGVRERHLDYFCKLARLAEPNLRGKDQSVWLNRLEDELDNLRSAIEWSLTTRIEAGMQLCADLQWFWHIRGHGSEGIDWLNQLLDTEATGRADQPVDSGRRLARANALNAAGFLLCMQNHFDPSRLLLQESLEIFKGLGQAGRRGMAISLLRLTETAGDFADVAAQAEESMAIFRELGDKFNIAECLQQLGGHWLFQGNFDGAKRVMEENLAIRMEIGDQDGMGTAYSLLGNLAVVQGEYNLAGELYEKSYTCYQAVDNIRYASTSIFNLARLSFIQGDYDQATRRCEEAMAKGLELESRQIVGNAYSVMGMIAWARGDYAQAQKRSEDELAVGQETGDMSLIINAHYLRGKVALSQKDYLLAYEKIREVSSTWSQRYLYAENVERFLVFIAILAAGWNQMAPSTTLFGAAEQICPWATFNISPAERTEQTNALAVVRGALGEEAFAAAWAAGQAMTVDQAFAYVMEVHPGD